MINTSWYRQQYQSQPADAQLVMDVLSIHLYPLEKHTLFDAVQLMQELPRKRFDEILQDLKERELGGVNVTGNFTLAPELNFLLFPANIVKPQYLQVIGRSRMAVHAFYTVSARLQDLQQLLVAYFTGDKYLLLAPVKRVEAELDEYLPAISWLLYYPEYAGLLQLFSQQAIDRMYAYAMKYQLLQLPPMADLLAFEQRQAYRFPELLLMQGLLSPAMADETADDIFMQAVWLLYHAQPDKALKTFDKGIKRQRQYDKKNTIPVSPLFAFWYAFTLMLLPGGDANPVISKILTAYERKLFPAVTPAVALLYFHTGKKEKAENLLLILLERNESRLLSFLAIMCLQLLHPRSKLLYTFRVNADALMRRVMEHHYRLLLYEYLYLLRNEGYGGYAPVFHQLEGSIQRPPVFSLLEQTADWERLLNTLLVAEAELVKKEKKEVSYRLIYLLDFSSYKIQPVLQSSAGDGQWSSGRQVALKKLKEGKAEAMTDQDFRIGGTVHKDHYYNYDGEYYSFDARVWNEIAGHPLLFLADNPAVPVEVVKGIPELAVNNIGNGYTFSCDITDFVSDTIFLHETPARLKIIKLTARQRKVLQTLSQIPVVPAAGKDKLMEVLRSIGAHITIHADLGEGSVGLRRRNGDPRIVVQLLPYGNGLKAALFVKPFTADPPYCKPGQGAAHIIGMSNGARWQAARDLALEKTNAEKLQEMIQQIVPQELMEDVILFEDPVDCLELLELIKDHPELVRPEWPEGERYRVRQTAGFSGFTVNVKQKGHWFACEGELRVDEDLVLSLKDLLDTTRIVNHRFIALSNGEFVALTSDLRKRLNELASIGTKEKDGWQVPQFAAPVLEELLAHAGAATTDAAWKIFTLKRETAMAAIPEVPATLQATLRPYQEEGFRWMTHLAAWGAGACLADDMGLGKTIQSVALLLYRAALGPALVVCPASVIANWAAEIARFAPSLNVSFLHNSRREAVIGHAAPLDVIITSYGLLQSEGKLLAGRQWGTVILDEAHHIKNHQTKTSRAAMMLQADFRVMLTGTPIQNQLTEIWNLFRFLNPGLLGSLDHFNEQFVYPVLRNPESTVKAHLRKLLAPFILRRTKTAVLDELPAKTEITRLIQLTPEEATFYEALRRKAVENLETFDATTAGQQRFRALAEISRLRMAACHPQLVDTESRISSSKLEAFLEITAELIANKHRALVFSQFVKHLDIVRNALDQQQISYLYMDGATPVGQRDQLVKDFQSGNGELFLLSLKAGGIGLNLTAADYVIHLDPWWNPAVEEQASDRAHRIGQTRPVTVYRLVAQHTIEEKILALHNSKRDLADRLLEGSDQAGRLSAEELMDLMAAHF
ncbi:DEAD/DEAH box helicase [Chitinophaga solisilvae]|uniref:DEAD/DEAH box helicase n=1 Tax=Chitinophaga solisilvae TaxID=1233460 RepID=UPI00136EDFEA|nr:DEAD/DEAH box helicase [Chitinophaga solisilvae]